VKNLGVALYLAGAVVFVGAVGYAALRLVAVLLG
jgi:hypothetical protein